METSCAEGSSEGSSEATETGSLAVLVAALSAVVLLSGCVPLTVAAGVGASAGVTHTMGGITYRTFTLPMPQVRKATMTALGRMGIKVASTSTEETTQFIKATASGREIEIQLEPLSATTTRMRAVARNGLFYDSATATEIILQTEKALGQY